MNTLILFFVVCAICVIARGNVRFLLISLFIIVFEAAQLIENQLIYPHVVGSSVGLSALWTLVAVLVGGSFFGVLGMIFFIPLVAVVYNLVSGNLSMRLRNRGIKIED